MSEPAAGQAERYRVASGGRIDRTRRIGFTFDGRALTGHPGDTLASALLANGIHLVGRSFKYHRPRGILSAGSEEPNALVTIARDWRRTTPNLRATEVELYDGLAAVSQNRWPSLAFDVASVNDRVAPLLPAGFYYKTLMGRQPGKPGTGGAWTRHFEPAIRRLAGLGRAPIAADPDRYASRFAHCDVLVVGAGPAGLAAARAAADMGACVIVADEQAEFGGTLLGQPDATIAGAPAWDWLAAEVAALAQHPRVRLLRRTTVFGAYPDRMLGLAERISDHLASPDAKLPRERLWQVRAREIVLATGAIERPLVFPGNDRPGIMLSGAVATYLNRYGVLAGTRAAVVTATDAAYGVAADMSHHGVRIAAIVDVRERPGEAARARAAAAGIEVLSGWRVTGTSGRLRVASVTIEQAGGRRRQLACDLVGMAGGMTPTLHLLPQLGGRLAWNEAAQAFAPVARVAHVHLAGAAAGGHGDVAAALAAGAQAGAEAARAGGYAVARQDLPAIATPSAEAPAVAPGPALPPASARGRAFVDFQNDVTTKDLGLATREGFRSIEHVKRYTTSGMATDQGKTSNVNALGVVAASLGRSIADLGHTTFRPPFTPVTFGALAGEARGELFEPVRRTPIDAAARDRGAVFENVGQWQRARYFPRAGEDISAAVVRECRTVREAVGVFDGSTLGKIEVVGPGAAQFLDRMYVNALATLPVGRCRYAIMLSEPGFVMDDGIVARLSQDRFHVTTTTGGSARVLTHMEDYLETEFTDCRCWLTSTTEQWGVIAVQGPRAREVLAPLVAGVDMSPAALPHMGLAEGHILGVPMRLFRVSFTGELGYEVNVPAGQARAVWDAVLAGAEAIGGCAYGTEAMHVLRAEKGYIIVGQESDGTVTPMDLGLPTGGKKRDFVGKRGLARPDFHAAGRFELVGLESGDGGGPLEEGAQIVAEMNPAKGTPAIGYVTSAYRSPQTGMPFALALIKSGRSRIGESMWVAMPGGAQRVRVVAPVFVDPTGGRLHG